MVRSKAEIISEMVDSGLFTDDEIRSAAKGSNQPQQTGFMDALKSSARSLVNAPVSIAKSLTPENIAPYAPVLGSIAGGAVAGPMGAAVGAGTGQIVKRMAGMAYGNEPLATGEFSPSEAIAPAAQTFVGGIGGVGGVQKAISKLGAFARSAGETLSGAKKDILGQAYKQGYKTYLAPSMDKASELYGEALGPEGRAVMKQTADEVFSPQAGLSRRIAKRAANEMESGATLEPLQALKARKATDRVISSTPVTDKSALGGLYEWRGKFDQVLSEGAPEVKKASTLYRQAIVKDTLTTPMRITKSGRPSAFLPLVLGAGSRGAAGILSTLTATSPMVWGLGATTLGQISRAMTPTVQRGIYSQFIDRIVTKEGQ